MIRSHYRWVIVAAGDTSASYTWLYAGPFGLGLFAFLIAMTFKSFPKPKEEPCPA